MSNTYFDLPSRLEDDFPRIDSDIVMNLCDTNEEYAGLFQQVSDLNQKYPFIDKLIDGSGEVHLTEDEHDAFVRYLSLVRRMENMERLQIYFRGHTDAVAYLKRIKAL